MTDNTAVAPLPPTPPTPTQLMFNIAYADVKKLIGLFQGMNAPWQIIDPIMQMLNSLETADGLSNAKAEVEKEMASIATGAVAGAVNVVEQTL